MTLKIRLFYTVEAGISCIGYTSNHFILEKTLKN